MTSALGEYAIIGDGRTCALVAPTGSIDFFCWPKFDSDACFAALLGVERHGFWRIAPAGYVASTSRRYRGDTMILETEHETDTGRVRVTDFMPWHDGVSALVRIVEGLEGSVPVALSLRLRFGYGQVSPWVQAHKRGLIAEMGPDRVILDSPLDLSFDGDSAAVAFTVEKGGRVVFILSYSLATDRVPRRLSVDPLFAMTENAWSGWIGRFNAPCRWPDAVKRSLLTLRALTYRKGGGIVAAATLGLPELPGGSLNWDYRYCWLRDSTFTLTALVNAGLHEEAKSWRDWILRAVGGEPSTMQIVYRIDGRRRLPEHELGGLPGYRSARPVRIGNAASGQTQLDVFGELMDSFDVLSQAGITRTPRVIAIETAVVRHLESMWDQPGADIWEGRGDPRLYTYSQVMAWVGIDRFLKAHEENGDVDPALISRLKPLRATIHHTICERGYSSDYGHFIQHYESDTLDASLLLLPLVGFLPVEDFRIVGTIAAVERELMDGGLVRRKAPSAEGPDEGAFLACSCWLADCYKMQGRDEEAAALLERVIGLSNDVGLLSKEYHVSQQKPSRQHTAGTDASGHHQHRAVPVWPGRAAGRRMKRPRGAGRLFAAAPLLLLGGCDAVRLGFLNAAGPVAGGERHLFIIVAIVMIFVAGPVLLLTPIIAWYYRLSNKNSAYRPDWEFSWPLEGLIWIPPAGIVIGLAFLLWPYTHRYDPYTPLRSTLPPIEVQAVGLDWKWLFIYPDRGIATVNQLAIPVGQPVHLSLTSGTVMQSMLVPRLAGQIYAMAGMTTQLNLAADRPGTFTGENTQFNGTGFQQQKFAVVSMPPEDYAQWLERVCQSARPLDAAAYAQLFEKSAPASPIFYSSVPPGLFQIILDQSRAGTPEATR